MSAAANPTTYTVNAFNIILLKLIKEVRAVPDLKKDFDTAYRKHLQSDKVVFDKDAPGFVRDFKPIAEAVGEAVEAGAFELEALKENPVLCGLPLGIMIPHLDRVALENYLLTLSCVSRIHEHHPAQSDVDTLMKKLSDIEEGEDVEVDDILDDRISAMLHRLMDNNVSATEQDLDDILKVKPEELAAQMQNSKIASLAQEISKSMDFESVKDPKDLLSGGMLGNMIKTVSDTVHKKINDGSLNHEELLSEAFGMMKSLNTNQLFKGLNLRNLSRMASQTATADTKTRMRRKVDERAKVVRPAAAMLTA